ncbi:Oidioi.mRNA.OKI2018_I69.chr1.g190.t1.cds [Oikopleura dioica]|uniref:Oidioi.mRNA.OKI2018_I69.chr1.g190.t1.cds n=1 Tax=Oikopleura dioica TaxID=34765 RepID=A0ABN7SNB4_OIKDI|nr:Oidioi.mRNA.OKI2018_I69.chr1.g190.t1.cds [Oikopleura dioica]
MKIPKFAFVCCCCCTWAAVSADPFNDKDHLDFHGEFDPDFSKFSHDLPELKIETTTEHDHGHSHDHETTTEHDDHGHSHDHEDDDEEWSNAQAWGYATLANTVCVLLSLAGVGIILCNKRASPKMMTYIYDFFIALGVSTMLGDAFLHILPAVLGLHSHDDGEAHAEEDHGHEHRHTVTTASPDEHGHSHEEPEDAEPDLYMEAIKNSPSSHGGAQVAHADEEMATRKTIVEETSAKAEEAKQGQVEPVQEDDEDGEENENKEEEPKKQTSAIMGILVGDCIHNFVDGLALGTTWAQGWETGLATTIALFLHELPHELSDFTIYIRFGLTNAMALGANLFSALWSYGGLYTGLALSSNTDASEWLLAMVAGLFVYIVLVDIIPELKLKGHFENKWTRFAIQNVGMTIGFIILAMLGVFEGRSHSHEEDDHGHSHDH